jgi:hypothetical protein
MQQARADSIYISINISQYAGDFYRVDNIRVVGLAHLAVVRGVGKVIGLMGDGKIFSRATLFL